MRIAVSPAWSLDRTGRNAGPVSSCGFTLIELLLTIGILAVLAVLAAPYLRVPTTLKLETASARIADAVRFARDEAILTGELYGVMLEPANLDHPNVVLIAVVRWDGSTLRPVEHPVTHFPYVIRAAATATPRMESVDSALIVFESSCNAAVENVLIFDGHGIPRCLNPLSNLMESAALTLSFGHESVTISVDPFTGRVVTL